MSTLPHLSSALDRSVERLEDDDSIGDPQALERALKVLSKPVTTRPHVFVAKVVDPTPKNPILDYVVSLPAFREMLNLLTEIAVVKTYCGPDATEVTVVTARLPEDYVARVPYVRLKHIPQEYKHRRNVCLVDIGKQEAVD